ncbi:AraC family transcriptional regulator [Alteromonadaceae bacterium M269]|nr:AraC family transcriptional regulator [Alteromonadaceae bacterium M269]
MKFINKFAVSPKWQLLFHDMDIDVATALKYAQLPLDLFSRKDASLTADEYFRLWEGIDRASGDVEIALKFAKHVSTESFDAPIFAALCCPNLHTAASRLSEYKALIGPMKLKVTQSVAGTKLDISCAAENLTMPHSLCMVEATFFTQLARIGTRQTIYPVTVAVPELPQNLEPYEAYFGCPITQGQNVSIQFSEADANLAFLTSSGTMWNFFEEKLNQKLADMTLDSSMSERVRATLIEILPSGESSIDVVADRLAISKRTLQRKLTSEAETFQSILTAVRDELACHYLEKSDMSLGEISYLLGFKEPNSFIRAFQSWQGTSPNYYRSQVEH